MSKFRPVYTEFNHNDSSGNNNIVLASKLCDDKIFNFVSAILKTSGEGLSTVMIPQDGIFVSKEGNIRKYNLVGVRLLNVRPIDKLCEKYVPWCQVYVSNDWKQVNNTKYMVAEFFLAVDLNVFQEHQKLFSVDHREKLLQRDVVLSFLFFVITFYCIYFGLFNHWQGHDDPIQDYLAWMFAVPTYDFDTKQLQELVKNKIIG